MTKFEYKTFVVEERQTPTLGPYEEYNFYDPEEFEQSSFERSKHYAMFIGPQRKTLQSKLKEMGNQGWELVSFQSGKLGKPTKTQIDRPVSDVEEDFDRHTLIFKRSGWVT